MSIEAIVSVINEQHAEGMIYFLASYVYINVTADEISFLLILKWWHYRLTRIMREMEITKLR